jgi:ribulose-5-phosphate 4-epimerase/fuculose-1-phosphate aldolase
MYKNIIISLKAYDDIGIHDFIELNKRHGMKILLLTRSVTDAQDTLCDKITYSQIGCSELDIHTFNFMLMHMDAYRYETILITDHSTTEYCCTYYMDKELGRRFSYFTTYFSNIYDDLGKNMQISKFCGERFDLVQAGGGNISVKSGELMFIKASGINLSEVDIDKGYVVINNNLLLQDLDSTDSINLNHYNIFKSSLRGSMETYMHSILKKYVVHLHPIQVNKILVLYDAKNIISTLFPDALVLDYYTPGLDLYHAIKHIYDDHDIIFLLNHGIIINTNVYDNIKVILNSILTICEQYTNSNYDKFKLTNTISEYINDKYHINNVTYLSVREDIARNIYLFQDQITCPDVLIYCGYTIIYTISDIDKYYDTYKILPKIIVLNNNVYINAVSLRKCVDIESVLHANLLVLESTRKKQYLSVDNMSSLLNSEAEKYRMNKV